VSLKRSRRKMSPPFSPSHPSRRVDATLIHQSLPVSSTQLSPHHHRAVEERLTSGKWTHPPRDLRIRKKSPRLNKLPVVPLVTGLVPYLPSSVAEYTTTIAAIYPQNFDPLHPSMFCTLLKNSFSAKTSK
jgi:hypothetical protein